jgi:DNA polymerase III subunit epsilon
MRMLHQLRRGINRITLSDRSYEFLFEAEPEDEAISLDCETTGFDPRDEILSIAAVRISGRRILASSAFHALVRPPRLAIRPASIKVHQLRQQDVAEGRPMDEVLPELLRFIGSRPLVGYWIDFDVRMIDKYLIGMLNIGLPNRQIDVSRLYYDRKYTTAPPGTRVDLRYAAIRDDLALPPRRQHDAFEDALGAAEAYLLLDDLAARNVYLARGRATARGAFSVA